MAPTPASLAAKESASREIMAPVRTNKTYAKAEAEVAPEEKEQPDSPVAQTETEP